ncbi:MAG TPA: maleylpyruvate isomerase N-terminal domain-containing protein [Actinomycetota bacterium]|nr:maleylpyruvate isomerase N-terminal domain-containing protein [Actinomycetota bacterium]
MQDEVVRLISEQRAALLGAIGRAGPADWDRPTVCAPWTLKDVLAHMVEGELNVGRIYRGEVKEQGYIDPEDGISKWRALPGEAVRAALWQHGTAAQRVLDAMTEEVWRAPIKAYGCREVRQLVRLHAFDVSVHGHDLTDALEIDPVWEPALPFLAEFVVRAASPTLMRRGFEPEGGSLLVDVGKKRWLIESVDGGWRIDHSPSPESGAASFETDEETLVLLTTGRGDREKLLSSLAISRDSQIGQRILEAWRVV